MEFDDRCWRAYSHWQECQTVGFTDEERRDEAVRKVAAIASEVSGACDRVSSAREQWHGAQAVIAAMDRAAGRSGR